MTLAKIRANHPYYPDELALADYTLFIRGIYVGGCVDERNAWGVWEGADGHAHNHRTSDWFGWICIKKPEDVLTPTGKHSKILLHEVAHLLVPNAGHTYAWKRTVTELGAGSEIERCELAPLRRVKK